MGCHEDCARVTDWLEVQLRTMDRVESYRHSFTDVNINNKSSSGLQKTNVYGILRASPLADGKVPPVLIHPIALVLDMYLLSTLCPYSHC